MPYKESTASCDWCKSVIYDCDSIACGDCHERLEAENQELRQRVETLESDLSDAIAEIDSLTCHPTTRKEGE